MINKKEINIDKKDTNQIYKEVKEYREHDGKRIIFITRKENINKIKILKLLRFAHNLNYSLIGLDSLGDDFVKAHVFECNNKKYYVDEDIKMIIELTNFFNILFDESNDKINLFKRKIKGIEKINNLQKNRFMQITIPIKDNVIEIESFKTLIERLEEFEINKIVFILKSNQRKILREIEKLFELLDFCINREILALTKNIPPCLMINYEEHISELYNTPDNKFDTLQICRKCALNDVCKRFNNLNLIEEFLTPITNKDQKINQIIDFANFKLENLEDDN